MSNQSCKYTGFKLMGIWVDGKFDQIIQIYSNLKTLSSSIHQLKRSPSSKDNFSGAGGTHCWKLGRTSSRKKKKKFLFSSFNVFWNVNVPLDEARKHHARFIFPLKQRGKKWAQRMHMTCELDTVQDFLCELDMKPNNVKSRALKPWLFQIVY